MISTAQWFLLLGIGFEVCAIAILSRWQQGHRLVTALIAYGLLFVLGAWNAPVWLLCILLGAGLVGCIWSFKAATDDGPSVWTDGPRHQRHDPEAQ